MIFFGKREPEKVGVEGLEPLVDSLFEKRLGQFGQRAAGATRELRSACEEFGDACREFKALEDEPYTSNIYKPNINSIKSQKGQYAEFLEHIVEKLATVLGETRSSYHQYKTLLSDLDRITNEVLRANASFRTVLFCYANNLERFKSSFSKIERIRETLRREIESKAEDAAQYDAVSASAAAVNSGCSTIKALKLSLDSLKEAAGHKGVDVAVIDESGFQKGIESKKAELRSLNKEIDELANRIKLLAVPLERASKKFDHTSDSKIQLYDFIADPISHINSEQEYSAFIERLNALKDAVGSGKIETKNMAGTMNEISALKNADIYSLISKLKALKERRSAASSELGSIERDLDRVKLNKEGIGKEVQEIASTEEKIKEAEKSVASAKERTESLLMEYYQKGIKIMLGPV